MLFILCSPKHTTMKWKELPTKSLAICYMMLFFGQIFYLLGKLFSFDNMKWLVVKLVIWGYIIFWLYSYFHSWYGTLNQFK